MQLTTAEEQIMGYLWQLEKAFMKEIVEAFPEPKPAYTTIATLLTRMVDKGSVGYTQYGKVRQYYPMISKQEYFSKQINSMIKTFFQNSSSQFASFFTNQADLSVTELEELKEIVERQIDHQKNKKS